MSKGKKIQDKAATVATPAVEAKLVIPKLPKTILEGGLTYSLISRVRNSFPSAKVNELEAAEKGDGLELIDGRGAAQVVSEPFITMARQLGAKFLAGTKSSFLRPRIQWDGKQVSLKELEKKVVKEVIKEAVVVAAPAEEKVAKSA